jgi:hypothetical protein
MHQGVWCTTWGLCTPRYPQCHQVTIQLKYDLTADAVPQSSSVSGVSGQAFWSQCTRGRHARRSLSSSVCRRTLAEGSGRGPAEVPACSPKLQGGCSVPGAHLPLRHYFVQIADRRTLTTPTLNDPRILTCAYHAHGILVQSIISWHFHCHYSKARVVIHSDRD